MILGLFASAVMLGCISMVIGCTADRVRIGPYDYRRVLQESYTCKLQGNLINLYNFTLHSNKCKFNPYYPFPVSDFKPDDVDEKEGVIHVIKPENYSFAYAKYKDIYRILVQTDKIDKELKKVYEFKLNASTGIKQFMGDFKSNFYFYTDEQDELLVHMIDIGLFMEMHSKVYCFGYRNKRYYFYNGYTVDSLNADNVEDGSRVEFETLTKLEESSIVYDNEDNMYMCHSKGLLMWNKNSSSGVEVFGNFSQCSALSFFGRYVFMASESKLNKYNRCPEPLSNKPGPPITPTATMTTKKTTMKSKKTIKTVSTLWHDAEFISHDGHQSDYVIPLISFGYFVGVLSIFGCMGYFVFTITEDKFDNLCSICPSMGEQD